MKKHIQIITTLSIITALVTPRSYAQFPDDALRFSSIGLGLGARSLGMGMAYTGIANDYSAVYWNPAGLGQIRKSELSVGLSHFSYDNTSTFFGQSRSFTNSSTSLNNFGLVYPFPTVRGSLVFAVGYSRVNDFTTGLSFDGFNPRSSILPALNEDLAYELYLDDVITTVWSAGFEVDSMQQRGRVLEDGGLSNWSFSGAVEAAKQLYLGLALHIVTGSYTYNRDYSEIDVFNKYSVQRFDTVGAFSRFNMVNTINGDISGFTAKFGMLYRFDTGARLGLGIKFPSVITVRERFSTDGTSIFDVPDRQGRFSYTYRQEGRTEYEITSPFVFSAGISVPFGPFILAGDVEYGDWTQVKFSDADPQIEQYNTSIKELFRPTANLRGGMEYEIEPIGVRLRGGFAYHPSPYRGDPASFAQKYITGGLGFIVQNIVAIDLGYAYGFWETYRVNYDLTSRTLEDVKTNNLIATISYRF